MSTPINFNYLLSRPPILSYIYIIASRRYPLSLLPQTNLLTPTATPQYALLPLRPTPNCSPPNRAGWLAAKSSPPRKTARFTSTGVTPASNSTDFPPAESRIVAPPRTYSGAKALPLASPSRPVNPYAISPELAIVDSPPDHTHIPPGFSLSSTYHPISDLASTKLTNGSRNLSLKFFLQCF